MARNMPKAAKAAVPRTPAALPAYKAEDVTEMEKLSLEKANKAISAIENALAVWNASKEKPDELAIRIRRLKSFYDALTNWEKKTLKSMGRSEALSVRINNLREFSNICHMFA